MEKKCICGNDLSYGDCCGKFIEGKKDAQSAVELMRSRYSAYVLRNGQYLYDTCSAQLKNTDDIKAIESQKIEWIGLRIESFDEYEVTFIAYFREKDKIETMKERSFFVSESGKMRYDRGQMLEAELMRNDPCPCGSGKKYKKCCALNG